MGKKHNNVSLMTLSGRQSKPSLRKPLFSLPKITTHNMTSPKKKFSHTREYHKMGLDFSRLMLEVFRNENIWHSLIHFKN